MYVHKCCTGKQFRKNLNIDIENWHCSKCNDDIDLPFNHIK